MSRPKLPRAHSDPAQTRNDGVTRSRPSIFKRNARSARSGDDIEQQVEIQQQDDAATIRDAIAVGLDKANSAIPASQLIINCN